MSYRDSRIEYFEDLIVPGAPIEETEYGLFKESYRDVAVTLDSMVSSQLSIGQIREGMMETEEVKALKGKDLESVMNHYDKLGIVSSRVNSFDRSEIYKIPTYHGRGGSKSWNDIVEELEEDMMEAEQIHCWKHQGEGIYDITDFE